MNNHLILIVGFILVSKTYCGDKPKKLAELQDNLWGEQIGSPQISPGGNLIGHHAVGQGSFESKIEITSPTSSDSDHVAPSFVALPATALRSEHPLIIYKQGVCHELGQLEQALEVEGFDLENLSLNSKITSPRVRIKTITSHIKEAKMVTEAIESNREKIQNKWHYEDHKLFGSGITSMHECHNLVRQLGSNGTFRILMGTSFLVGLYLYRKKGN